MEILRRIYFFLLDIAQTLILGAAAFVFVYVFIFKPFVVSGDSMFPNFHDKEYLITSVISLRLGNPKLGDVIVFKAPPEPDKDFIKRVIGIPGDQVSLGNGQVYLNGKLLDENKYLKPTVKTYSGSFLKDNETITVPPGNYFVLGDNRSYSSDSREWGFVPRGNIIGESFFVYWPLSNLGEIKNPY